MFRMRNANCRAPPEDERFIEAGDGHWSDRRLRLPASLLFLLLLPPPPTSCSSSSDMFPGPPSLLSSSSLLLFSLSLSLFHPGFSSLHASRQPCHPPSTTGRVHDADHDHDRDQRTGLTATPTTRRCWPIAGLLENDAQRRLRILRHTRRVHLWILILDFFERLAISLGRYQLTGDTLQE